MLDITLKIMLILHKNYVKYHIKIMLDITLKLC